MKDLFFNICLILVFTNVLLYSRGFFYYFKAYKILTIYLVIVFLSMLLTKYSDSLNFEKVIIIHIYIFFRFIFLSLFYKVLIQKKEFVEIIFALLFMFSFSLLISFYLNPKLLHHYNLSESFVCSFLIALYSLYYAYEQIDLKKKFYHANLGILLYSFGGSIFYIYSSLLEFFNPSYFNFLANINYLFGIVSCIMISFEWYKNYYKLNKNE